MADIAALRAGLVANLAPLGRDVQVSPYPITNPEPPTAYVDFTGPVEYDRAMGRGHDAWRFTVFVIVGTISDIAAHMRLDSMLVSSGTGSVKTLLESDQTLGGAAQTVHVPSSTGPRPYVLDMKSGTQRAPFLGAEWTVDVLAGNS